MSTPATLVRIEWFKLRTTPALPVTLACTLLLAVGAGATNVFLAGQTGLADLGTAENVGKVLAVGAVTSTVMLVIGIMIGAAEHRHRTVVGTYLGEPRRARVLLAQLATGALVGAVGGAFVFGTTYAAAVVLYAARGVHTLPVDVAALGMGTVLITACYGLLGVALGALTRNMIAAIVTGLVWVTVIEVALLQPLVPSLAKWLPTGAAVALTTVRSPGDHLLPPGPAALLLILWAAGLAAVALGTSVRREVR